MRAFRWKLTSVLQTTATLVALACAAVLLVPQLLGWKVETVLSGSMHPTYGVQSVVIVKPLDPAGIKVGDIINFRSVSSDTPITHRVVAIERDGAFSFVTKGDANKSPDPDPVAPAAIHGRVIFGIPVLGRLVRALQTPLGFSLLLVLPGLVLIASQLRDFARNLRPAPSIPEESTS